MVQSSKFCGTYIYIAYGRELFFETGLTLVPDTNFLFFTWSSFVQKSHHWLWLWHIQRQEHIICLPGADFPVKFLSENLILMCQNYSEKKINSVSDKVKLKNLFQSCVTALNQNNYADESCITYEHNNVRKNIFRSKVGKFLLLGHGQGCISEWGYAHFAWWGVAVIPDIFFTFAWRFFTQCFHRVF